MKTNTILLILNPKPPKKSRGGYSHLSNLKSIAVIAMMLLFLGVGNAWGASCNDWLTDAVGGGTYADIYKVLCPMTLPAGGYVVNVQKPWGSKPGIYFNNMGTGVTACSLGDGNWSNNGGAGLLLHLDALTNQETEVTVTVGGIDYTFTVYNKNGTTGGGGSGGGGGGGSSYVCEGTSTTAYTGGNAFILGYDYTFTYNSSTNDLTIEIEFLDEVTGLADAATLYDWYSGGEVTKGTMSKVSGQKYSTTLSSVSSGTNFRFVCSAAYANGGVFKTDISYQAGEECGGSGGGGGSESCDTQHFYFVNTFTDRAKFSTPYAYLWESGSNPTNKNATWPGVALTKATDVSSILADYVYEVTYDGNFDKVIFSDNGSYQKAEVSISDCKFYMNGDWYGSIEEVEAMMVFFVNTGGWSDANVKVHIWKNGGSAMNTWNDSKETMYYTGTQTNDNHKVYFYPCYPDYYDKIQFHNSGSNSDQPSNQAIEATHFFNYGDKCYYTSTKYLNFSNSGWSLNSFDWSDLTGTVQTATITISNAESNYEFNIKSAGESFYYNHGTMTENNCTNWKFNENSSSNCWINPDVVGDYLFKYDFAENKLSVVYPPYMTSASLDSKTATTAVISVESTRGTKYKVVDEGNSISQTLTPSDGKITVTDLTPGTQYTFTVTALDDNDTESANEIEMSPFYTLPTISSASYDSRTYNTITLSVSGTGASQYKVTNTSPSIDQTLTPSDGKVTVTGLTPYTSYSFNVKAVNAGGATSTESINVSAVKTTPQMTTATLDSKTQTTMVLSVASTGGSTYKVTSTSGTEYALSSATPADGQITVTNLTAGTAYTFRVYAKSSDATPIQSSNYIDVTTSTYPNVNSGPTGYYDCQVQAIHTSGDEYSPLGMILANWGYPAGGTPYTDGSSKKAYKVNTNTTFYAGLYFGSNWTETPTTLCNASSCTKLHVEFWSAEAQSFNFNVIAYYNSQNNDGTPQSVTTTAGSWKVMDFTITDFGTTVSDHKDVISAFKIDYRSGNTGKELIIANAYFYTPDVCESMKCHGSGSAGSGLTINTAEVFDTGESYWTKAYMYNSKLHIDAKFTSASSVYAAAAYVQFVKLDGGILQFGPMTNNADSFSIEVTPSDVTDAYRYDGIARYSVKFELSVSPKIRQTDYHYYDFTNSECAPDYFDIYHYDDATGSQRTSYAGGTILQPIRYFRHFEHTDWCAITFPFSVSKVVVDEGGTEYDLYPRFNNGSSDVEGYYWLKTFDNWNSTPVAISEFQSAWKQLTVSTASSDDAELAGLVKPAKDVPYVIAFPDGSYYGTYWVIFYGDAEQTIASSEDSSCGTSFSGDGETVKLQRNNMMQPTSSKTNIYMLEEGHNYYSRQTQAIPAFESYVIGTATVQGKYRVLRMDNVSTPETPTDIDALPTTECRGAIYSLSGMRIATFADRDAMEQLLSGLSAGVYVVRAGAVINKIVVQ